MKNIRFKDYLIDYLEFYNITNKDFANRIGVTPKHLIDILSGNVDISSNIIENISLVTDISIDFIYKIENNYKLEKRIEDFLEKENLTMIEYLNKFNYKYLKENNYVDFIDYKDKLEDVKDILKFLRVTSPEKVYDVDKSIYYKSKNDKPELLLLWLEKCYRGTFKQDVGVYKRENIDVLVGKILDYAKEGVFDEEKLVDDFNKNGIFLVIQDDIPGSKIRGAFKVHRGKPAIYLTHKHKRIADIYFALLHELAHCKSDFNKAMGVSLVSYDYEDIDIEKRADIQALNWMVSEEYYNNICSNVEYDIDRERKFPKSFIMYRLAHDKLVKYSSKEYQKYNYIVYQ